MARDPREERQDVSSLDNVDAAPTTGSESASSGSIDVADRHEIDVDWQETSPSEAVVMAVADVSGADPLEIDPLYSTIDPDALNALFQPDRDSPPNNTLISFILDGVSVTVHSEGRIELHSVNGLNSN